jgi:hypothetical protein
LKARKRHIRVGKPSKITKRVNQIISSWISHPEKKVIDYKRI